MPGITGIQNYYGQLVHTSLDYTQNSRDLSSPKSTFPVPAMLLYCVCYARCRDFSLSPVLRHAK